VRYRRLRGAAVISWGWIISTAPLDKKPAWRFAAGLSLALEKAGALTQNVSNEHQQVRKVTNAGDGLELAGRKGSVEAGLLQTEVEIFDRSM
jgi:hypothetical protein